MFPFDSREFQVKYRPTGGFTVQQEAMKDVTVTLKRDQSVRQQIHNLIRANDMPLYIQVPLISAFDGWIEQNQQLQHPNWPQRKLNPLVSTDILNPYDMIQSFRMLLTHYSCDRRFIVPGTRPAMEGIVY